MEVSTYHLDATCLPTAPCDLVMCNFAIHYFCDTKAHCTALLDKVAACLQAGGTFCGTYERRVGMVEWGDAHHVVLGDCVDAIEWRVPWNQIVRMAHRRGLALVFHVPLYSIQAGSLPTIWAFIMRQRAPAQGYGT